MEKIDVLINSCARPDILEVSIKTFMEKVHSSREFRYVILEDKVVDQQRQRLGTEWIELHSDLFDEIVFSEKHMGPGFFFAPAVKLCKSKYFFHLEDDNEFIKDVNIDPLLDIMENSDNIIEIMMSRGPVNPINRPRKTEISSVVLTEFDLFSVATGVFNTELTRSLIDNIGWHKQLHEAGLLTPVSKELGYRKFVFGHDDQHYVHVGAEKGYRKGGYKNG